MISQQGGKCKVPLPHVSSPGELSQRDTSFAHPHKVQTQPRARPAHLSPRPSMTHLAFGACAGCLDAPGMEDKQEGRVLIARLMLTELTVGLPRHQCRQNCSDLVPSSLDFHPFLAASI